MTPLGAFHLRGLHRTHRPGDSGVRVSPFEHELGVTVPSWHTGQAARAVMELVWSYMAILEQETGWEIYDPQLGRSLTEPATWTRSAAGMPTCPPGSPGWFAETAPVRPSGIGPSQGRPPPWQKGTALFASKDRIVIDDARNCDASKPR
jgi:hypothetical protein